jgi:RimJ/RimL family protein N-acetyltransferase
MDGLSLKPVAVEHAEAMFRWMSDPNVADNLGLRRKPSLKRTRDWIEKMNRSQDSAFAIEWEKTHVGNVVLDQTDDIVRSARLSVYIGDCNVRGRGIGTAAIQKVLEMAFDRMNLNRVWLLVHELNLPALQLYKRLGFREEGRQVEAFYFREHLVDAILMAVLKRDFPSVSSKRIASELP